MNEQKKGGLREPGSHQAWRPPAKTGAAGWLSGAWPRMMSEPHWGCGNPEASNSENQGRHLWAGNEAKSVATMSVSSGGLHAACDRLCSFPWPAARGLLDQWGWVESSPFPPASRRGESPRDGKVSFWVNNSQASSAEFWMSPRALSPLSRPDTTHRARAQDATRRPPAASERAVERHREKSDLQASMCWRLGGGLWEEATPGNWGRVLVYTQAISPDA